VCQEYSCQIMGETISKSRWQFCQKKLFKFYDDLHRQLVTSVENDLAHEEKGEEVAKVILSAYYEYLELRRNRQLPVVEDSRRQFSRQSKIFRLLVRGIHDPSILESQQLIDLSLFFEMVLGDFYK
jgi:hypothetical protein